MNKVMLIGLDGGTFRIIKPLCETGRTPNLNRLIMSGTSNVLKSTVPPATVPAWPSFLTGKNPGKHGVYDFLIRSQEVLRYTDIQCETLIDILNRQGKKAIWFNIPPTYPPPKINGVVISGFLSPDRGYTNPPDVEQTLQQMGYIRVMDPKLVNKKWKEPVFFEELCKSALKRKEVVEYLMKKYEWDLFGLLFQETDVIQHKLFKNREIIEMFYSYIDGLLGEIFAHVGDDVNIIIISDHGFDDLNKHILINNWLHEQGLLKFMNVNKKGCMLTRVGLTQQNVMTILEKLHLEGILQHISPNIKTALPMTGQEVDYDQSKAYFASIFGNETQSININLKGRESNGIVDTNEFETLRDEIMSKLNSLTDCDKKVINRIHKGDNLYNGKHIKNAPDIIVETSPGYKLYSLALSRSVFIYESDPSGKHDSDGIFIASGPDIRPIDKCETPFSILDLAPTILHLMNIPIPHDVDGRVMREIFLEGSEPAKREIKLERKDEEQVLQEKIMKLKKLKKI